MARFRNEREDREKILKELRPGQMLVKQFKQQF